MERFFIKVDRELALNEIAKSHDFSGMSLSHRKTYVDAWCDGFLEGYIKGCIVSTIETICCMKQEGMSSTLIEKCTGISAELINKMGNS